MPNFMNSIKMLLEGKAEQASVDKAHFCATHVEHAEYGKGVCISEQHAEPDSEGHIEWYTVKFDGYAPAKVMTSEMKILQAEEHMHSKKKMKEDLEQVDEKLVGNQHKLDKNKNGKLDKNDFELLRKEGIAEAKKLVGTYTHPEKGHTTKVYRLSGMDYEGDNYHVKLFKGGKYYEPADYFTNDADDAHRTAKTMVKEDLDAVNEVADSSTPEGRKKIWAAATAGKKSGEAGKSGPEKTYSGRFTATKTEKGTKYTRNLEKYDEEINISDDELTETIIKHNAFSLDLPEELTYKDYLSAVRTIVNNNEPSIQSQIISIAAEAYDSQEYDIVIEARTKEFAQQTVDSLRRAGATVSDPEVVTHQGKPGFKYTRKDGEKETVVVHTAQGVSRKVK